METPQKPIAFAIFVKTPGLTPVKTRLARTFGKEGAEKFYSLSLKIMESLGKNLKTSLPGVVPVWAVAEEAGLNFWKQFPVFWQGEGDLGDRLAEIERLLFQEFSGVIFVGADTPQLDLENIKNAIKGLNEKGSVLGFSEDGGFYLYGNLQMLGESVWKGIPYSSAQTGQRLAEFLTDPHVLPKLRDVDEESDLMILKKQLMGLKETCPEQDALLSWLSSS